MIKEQVPAMTIFVIVELESLLRGPAVGDDTDLLSPEMESDSFIM